MVASAKAVVAVAARTSAVATHAICLAIVLGVVIIFSVHWSRQMQFLTELLVTSYDVGSSCAEQVANQLISRFFRI